MRLNKFIATHSEYSRRKADKLVAAGKVFINDKKVIRMGVQVDTENDIVRVGEVTIKPQTEKAYLALNKPAGYVTTRKDELERKTVMELMPRIPNLKPVGRLDIESEGLLLFSNDGNFINRLTHPRFECEKEYFTKTQGQINKETITKLEKGIMVEGKKTSKAKIKIIKSTQSQTSLTITIHEGRNRQIRKMFALVKHPVKYLKRLRIGEIELNRLKIGSYRRLTFKEIDVN